jgi:soluble lytic murein transglycosylase-like protein
LVVSRGSAARAGRGLRPNLNASSNPNRSRSRKARSLLLGLLALGLVSGTAAEPPTTRLAAVEDRGAAAEAWIEARLHVVNPTLDPRTRQRIASAIVRYSVQHSLDPELVTAVIEVESDARPWIRSPKGALGLMQVMPHMMQPLAMAGNSATIESNIEAGCKILGENIARLGEAKGISAYFWGSRVRNLVYLEKVQQARAEIRRLRLS